MCNQFHEIIDWRELLFQAYYRQFVLVREIESGLKLGEKDFFAKFGFDKPDKNQAQSIILYCTSGVRARRGQKIFQKFGFNGVRVYEGSFSDWASKGGDIERIWNFDSD